MKKTKLLLAFLCLSSAVFAQDKPRTWILSDYTGPVDYKIINNGKDATAVTDADSDPDDQVALAMYLMMANKFDTRAIVLGSTTKNTQLKTLELYQKAHGDAYATDRKCLGDSYPENINVKESSLTAENANISFSTTKDYKPFEGLPKTVQDLINELGRVDASNNAVYTTSKPLYVLVWGPMTEIAIATKHMTDVTAKNNLLSRMFVISHWTSSYVSQMGTPCSSFNASETHFKPANCNENCPACNYMHDEAAKSGAKFKFVDLGSAGQNGIVSGSNGYFTGGTEGVLGDQYKEFQKSKLGDLFVKSRFYLKKPDGSDCATFLALLGDYGVKLSDYSSNGTLNKTVEEKAIANFKNNATKVLDELKTISNKASSCSTTGTSQTFRAFPNPTTGVITLPDALVNDEITVSSVTSGTIVLTKKVTVTASTNLDISNQPNGNYIIKLVRNNQSLTRQIIKQ